MIGKLRVLASAIKFSSKSTSASTFMETSEKAPVTCGGCLSSHRRLATPSRDAQEFLVSLLQAPTYIKRSVSAKKLQSIKLCWECIAVLKKTWLFTLKVIKAHKFLEHLSEDQKTINISLSSLEAVDTSEYNAIKIEEIEKNDDDFIKQELEISTDNVLNVYQDPELELSKDDELKICKEDDEPDFLTSDFESETPNEDPFKDLKLLMEISEHHKELKVKEKLMKGSEISQHSNEKCEEIQASNPENAKKLKKIKNKYRDSSDMYDKMIACKDLFVRMREEDKKLHYFVVAPFKCESCITGFISEKVYRLHNEKYHSLKVGMLECKICKRRFKTKNALSKHESEHYYYYKCKVCGFQSFQWQITYRHYLITHEIQKNEKKKTRQYNRHRQWGDMYQAIILNETEVKEQREEYAQRLWFRTAPYRCLSCIKGFGSQTHYKYHHQMAHSPSAGKLICAVCDLRKKTKNEMVKHLLVHTRAYRCNVCSKLLLTNLAAYRHYTNVHRLNKMYSCKYCELEFEKRCEKKDHLEKMHKTFPCPKCDKKFKHQRSFQQHLESHEPRLCVDCGKWYNTRRSFESHRRQKHTQNEPSVAYCVECDKQFRSRGDYQTHIFVKHTHANRVFQCKECDKTYKRKFSLKNHCNQVHLKNSKHVCPDCNKTFVSNVGLKNHKEFVHEKRPKKRNYICELCKKGFYTKIILDNHRRTHTGEKPFQCTFCGTAFAQKVAMVYHMRNIHLKQALHTNLNDNGLSQFQEISSTTTESIQTSSSSAGLSSLN